PWNAQWFYGDLVFIIDPFMWVMFGGAGFLLTAKSKKQILFWAALAVLLTMLVLAGPRSRGVETSALLPVFWVAGLSILAISFKLKADQRWGNRIGITAFAVVAVYIGTLAILHRAAVSELHEQARAIATQNGESVTDIAAMPTLANPFNWLCVVETEYAAYRFELSLLGRPRNTFETFVRHERGDVSNSPAVENALHDRRVQIFLSFARFPVVRAVGADCLTETLVQFADLRYTQPGSTRGTFALELPVECPTQSTAGGESK
ncbi:MAG TPA: hypothetical protein VJM12_18595, partial [Pyrinomonadaceae bacterium]|nr:hypothetical protein [Pyrinomonadaceae bacterium]